jgi:hypothetical protein
MAGAMLAAVAFAVGGTMLKQGSSRPPARPEIARLPAGNPNSVKPAGENEGKPAEVDQAKARADAATIEALRKKAASAAAMEAQLAALKKSNAKAQPPSRQGVQYASTRKPLSAAPKSTGTSDNGVSQAKLAQFYSTVDDARAMAKVVMRKGNRQNVALAREYDANLKTLRDSMRGIHSDEAADKLIKQAALTRSYLQFLIKQP